MNRQRRLSHGPSCLPLRFVPALFGTHSEESRETARKQEGLSGEQPKGVRKRKGGRAKEGIVPPKSLAPPPVLHFFFFGGLRVAQDAEQVHEGRRLLRVQLRQPPRGEANALQAQRRRSEEEREG